MYSIPFPRICGNCECTRITNTPRVSAVPSRRGHLQSVLRDETLRHRLFRARQATRRASLRAPSRLRDGPAPRPRRNRLHELGAGDFAHRLQQALRLRPVRRPRRHVLREDRRDVDVAEPPRRAVRQLVPRRVPAVRAVQRPLDDPSLREQPLQPARDLPVGSRHSFFNHRSHIIETFSSEVKGESAKKSKYAGRAGMARRHPGPVDKGRLLRPTCAKNEGFVIRAADLETGFYTMKSPMRPEETTFHTRVCEIEGRGGHCRPDRRRRLRETPSAWPPFPSRSRQRKTRDRNAPAPINPFYMRVIPLGHLRCLISL